MTSPAGAPSKPRVTTRVDGDTIVTEAVWYCSRSGAPFHRGVVSIEPKKTDQNS